MFDLARKVAARGLVVAAIAAGAALISTPADARGWHGGGWHGGWSVGFYGPGPWWPGYYAGYWGPEYPYYPDTPQVTVIQQPAAAAQAAPPVYYYCDNPAGYYPYVQQCGIPWRQVPATPAPVSAPH